MADDNGVCAPLLRFLADYLADPAFTARFAIMGTIDRLAELRARGLPDAHIGLVLREDQRATADVARDLLIALDFKAFTAAAVSAGRVGERMTTTDTTTTTTTTTAGDVPPDDGGVVVVTNPGAPPPPPPVATLAPPADVVVVVNTVAPPLTGWWGPSSVCVESVAPSGALRGDEAKLLLRAWHLSPRAEIEFQNGQQTVAAEVVWVDQDQAHTGACAAMVKVTFPARGVWSVRAINPLDNQAADSSFAVLPNAVTVS